MKNHDRKVTHHSINVDNQVKSLLEEDIRESRDIMQLAKLEGYSKRWMNECFKNNEDKAPAVALREVRYHATRNMIISDHVATAAYVANAAASLWHEQNLYNFLLNHYQTNFTSLRFEILDDQAMNRNDQ